MRALQIINDMRGLLPQVTSWRFMTIWPLSRREMVREVLDQIREAVGVFFNGRRNRADSSGRPCAINEGFDEALDSGRGACATHADVATNSWRVFSSCLSRVK